MKFQDLARNFRKKQEDYLEDDRPESPHLNEESKKRMAELIDQDKSS
ncbi:hypothetical protein P0Y35_06720 [Kiritimatiellaeota bacterium B1221]|nr:hypothetical protein [Kiritimatiellaeota bacterium B1221]